MPLQKGIILCSALMLFFFSGLLSAQSEETVTIGVSFSIPPWVIKDSNSGIELDILNKALSLQNYSVEPLYASNERVSRMFDSGKIDGYINVKPGSKTKGYLSDTVVSFQNVAISIKNKKYPQNITVDFLKDKQVVGFQTASRRLGEEFSKMSQRSKFYREIADQSLQLNLLFIRGVDFIILDRSVFGYFWSEAISNAKKRGSFGEAFKQDVMIHPLFPKTDYAFIFKDAKVRDDFNRGLAKIRQSGQYDIILKKYDELRSLYGRPN